MTKYILVASGKGGVGKSTCAVNLAASFNYFNKDTILVDANINNPNLSLNLGLINLKRNLQDVLLGKYHIIEALYNHPSGIRIVPLSIETSYIAKLNLSNLRQAIYGLDGITDFVIVDGTSGNNIDTINLINSIDEVIVIVNPETASLTDAMKTIRIANYYKKPIRGIILNKTTNNDFFNESDIKAILKREVLGVIENDDKVKLSNYYKDSVVNLYPLSQSSLGFKKIASNLLNEHYEVEFENKGFFSKIFRR